jgi:ATP-binding cassette subfamily C protein
MMKAGGHSSFELFRYFIRSYPARTFVVFLCLVLAGFSETLGIGALLPLLTMVSGQEESGSGALQQLVGGMFSFLGIPQTFGNLLILTVAAISLKAGIVYFAMNLVGYAAADVAHDLRYKLIHALMKAKWEYYAALSVGKTANAIASEAQRAGQCYMLAGKAVASSVQAMVYLIAAFFLSWKVSLAAIFFGVIASFAFRTLVRMARDSGSAMTEAMNTLLGRLTEALSGAKPLKAMGQEDRFTALLNKDTLDVTNALRRQQKAGQMLQAFQEPLLVLLTAAGLFWGHTYGAFAISELLLLAFLFSRLLSNVNMIQNHYQKMVMLESAVWSMNDATSAAASHREELRGALAPSVLSEIRFENISLSYGDTRVLTSLSDSIKVGSMTAIYGPSGSGKSSLVDAVLGLKSVAAGTIFLDKDALSSIDIQAWRGKIGYVPQETFLFHDTVENNVTLGDISISEGNVLSALAAAEAIEFVKELPEGIKTVVGERGGKLSGGQRQRIALARALVRKPEFLILDEATSALDRGSEQAILSTLRNLTPSLTIIVISHSPQILEVADHVISLEARGTADAKEQSCVS